MSSSAKADRSRGGHWVRGAGLGSALALVALTWPCVHAEARGGRRSGADLAAGRFLVASRELNDPNFRRAVVLLVDYDRYEGAFGLVINRPSGIDLSRVLSGEEDDPRSLGPVFVGGPVAPLQFALLMRSESPPEGATRVLDDVYFSTSRELLERLAAASAGAAPFRAYAGYAGWSIGQLEAEVERGGWHVLEARTEAIFDSRTEDIWPTLILIGTAEWARLGGRPS